MSNHLPEWKRIKYFYESIPQTETIRFRIECISSLIESAESKEKELAHFR